MKQHASVQAAREIGTRTRDPSIRALIDYWLQIHPGDRLPGRRHLDPADIPELLPGIVLTDIERDPFRIRFRLVGTKVGEAFGEEFTGRYLDEAVPDWETSFIYLHRKAVAETACPTIGTGRHRSASGSTMRQSSASICLSPATARRST